MRPPSLPAKHVVPLAVLLVVMGALQAQAAHLVIDDTIADGSIKLTHDANWEFGVTSNGKPFKNSVGGSTSVPEGVTATFSGSWIVINAGSPDPGSGVIYVVDQLHPNVVSDIITASWSTVGQTATISFTVQSSAPGDSLGPLPPAFTGLAVVETGSLGEISGLFRDSTTAAPVNIPSNLTLQFGSLVDAVSVDTPTGSNVLVSAPNPPLMVDVNFTTVNGAGVTTVEALPAPPIPLPPDIAADVGMCSKTKALGCRNDSNCPAGETCKRYHALTFDVATTASVVPPITVCSHYLDQETKHAGGNGFVDGTGKPGIPEKALRLFHNEGGTFVDVTLPGYPDTLNNVVCGQVNSLSAFGMYVSTDMPGGNNGANDCMTEWSLCSAPGIGGASNGGGVGTLPVTSSTSAVPKSILTCSLNDPNCVGDTPGACTFCVRVCPNVRDTRLACTPTDVASYTLTKLRPDAGGVEGTNAANVLTALTQLDGGTANGSQVTFTPPLASGLRCTEPITLVVPLPPGKTKVNTAVGLIGRNSTGATDNNKLRLLCTP